MFITGRFFGLVLLGAVPVILSPSHATVLWWMLAVLILLVADIVAAGKPLAVCGEMGGRPLEAMALLGLGIRRLSITPAGIGPIKAMVRSLDLSQLTPFVTDLVARGTTPIRPALEGWGRDHGVELGL